MDSHPGWHAILGAVHRATGAGAPALVLFSVISLFIAFSLPALLLLRRPEAWLLAFFALAVSDRNVTGAPVHGAPFPAPALPPARPPPPRLAPPGGAAGGKEPPAPARRLLRRRRLDVSELVPVRLPVAAFFLAGHPRAALRLALVAAAGVTLAGLLTGQPIRFVIQSLLHPWMVFAGLGSPGGSRWRAPALPGACGLPVLPPEPAAPPRRAWPLDERRRAPPRVRARLHGLDSRLPGYALLGWLGGARRPRVGGAGDPGRPRFSGAVDDRARARTHRRARRPRARPIPTAVTGDIGGRWSRPRHEVRSSRRPVRPGSPARPRGASSIATTSISSSPRSTAFPTPLAVRGGIRTRPHASCGPGGPADE